MRTRVGVLVRGSRAAIDASPSVDARASAVREGDSEHVRTLADADEIRTLLRYVSRARMPVVARWADGSIAILSLSERTREGTLRFTSASEHVPEQAPSVLEAQGYNALYAFEARDWVRTASGFEARAPEQVKRMRQRAERRSTMPPAQSDVVELGLSSRGEHIRGRVKDLSHSGLAITTPVPPTWSVGRRIDGLKLGVHELPVTGDVRVLRKEGDEFVLGVKLESSAPSSDEWRRVVEQALYPQTRRAGEDVWELYRASGYLSLSDSVSNDEFGPLRAAYQHAIEGLDRAPELSNQIQWPQSGPAQVTLSHLRVYSGAWLGFQLARTGSASLGRVRDIESLRDVYMHSFEHAQSIDGSRWMLTYVNDHASWTKRLHLDWYAQFIPTGESCAVPFSALRVPSSWPEPEPALEPNVEVGIADSAEIALLLAELVRQRPHAYLDALDLTPEQLEMGAISGLWKKRGLERARTLLVARIAGRAVAAAVVETGEVGAHLYGLLDCVRMFELVPGGTATFCRLLSAARVVYQAAGRESFVYLEEQNGSLPSYEGMTPLGGAVLTTLPIARVPDLLEHVYLSMTIR